MPRARLSCNSGLCCCGGGEGELLHSLVPRPLISLAALALVDLLSQHILVHADCLCGGAGACGVRHVAPPGTWRQLECLAISARPPHGLPCTSPVKHAHVLFSPCRATRWPRPGVGRPPMHLAPVVDHAHAHRPSPATWRPARALAARGPARRGRMISTCPAGRVFTNSHVLAPPPPELASLGTCATSLPCASSGSGMALAGLNKRPLPPRQASRLSIARALHHTAMPHRCRRLGLRQGMVPAVVPARCPS